MWATAPIPAAVIVASISLIMTEGHDGLSLSLGVAGAIYLATIWPSSVRGENGLPDRGYDGLISSSGSLAVRRAVSAVIVLALTALMAAEFAAILLALRVIEGPLWQLAALFPAAIVLLTMVLRPGTVGVAGLTAALATGCAVVATLSLVSSSAGDGIGGLISIPTLTKIASFEQSLLEKRLADPATFKPFGVPFLRSNAMNVLALTATVAVGLAMVFRTLRADRGTSTAWLVSSMLLLFLLPPLAAVLKSALLAAVDAGLKVTMLPEWIVAGSRASIIEVCRATGSGDAASVAKACGKGFGPQGLLKWQDIGIAPDALPYVGMAAAGVPTALRVALAATVILVGGWTAFRSVALVVETLTGATGSGSARAGARIGATLVVLVAGLIALFNTADIAILVATAAAIAAAGLAPLAIATALARRVPPVTAVVAITLGAATALVMTTAPRFAPIATFNLSGSSTTAPLTVIRKLASLQDTIATVADGPGRMALRGQADRLARENTSWFGLKPVAAGLFGMALGALILFTGAGMARLRGTGGPRSGSGRVRSRKVDRPGS
jgi:hypothetical protein